MKFHNNNLIELNEWYVFDDLIVYFRSSLTHNLTNRKMKPNQYIGAFIEVSIHALDSQNELTSYKDVELKVCPSSCDHRHDNYKQKHVKQCYVYKPAITNMHKSINRKVRENINKSMYIMPQKYMIRLTLHGDICKLNLQGESLIYDLCVHADKVLGYTSDCTKLSLDFSPYLVQSAMSIKDVYKAKLLGYNVYYSGNDSKNDLKDLDNVIKCKTTIHSLTGCSTCYTPCGSSEYNIIAVDENTKKGIKSLAIKSGRVQSKGFTSYHFIYDLMLMSLIAIRLKSLIIFYFYLFIVYFFDLIDFVLSLFK